MSKVTGKRGVGKQGGEVVDDAGFARAAECYRKYCRRSGIERLPLTRAGCTVEGDLVVLRSNGVEVYRHRPMKAKPVAAPKPSKQSTKPMTWDDPRYQAFQSAFGALIDGLPDNDPCGIDRLHLMTSAGFIVEAAIGTGKLGSAAFVASLQAPLARVNAANAAR